MPSPLTIGYVFPWTVVGGGEVATLRLAKAIGEEVDPGGRARPMRAMAYVANAPGASLPRRGDPDEALVESAVARMCASEGLPVRAYGAPEFSYRHMTPFLRDSVRLARQFRRDRIDVLHCSDLMGVYHAGLAAALARVPLVSHIRSHFPDRLSRRRAWPIRFVDHFVFVSRATWTHFNHIRVVPPARGTVVYDWPPDIERTGGRLDRAARDALRQACGVASGAEVIAMVARVSPQKDFDTLFSAFVRVRARRPRAHLLLIGAPDMTGEAEALQRRWRDRTDADCPGGVTWTGHRTDVHELLLASDVVVLASHGEGVPLALLEAMAVERPVVATGVGGVPELVRDGQTGLLHRHGDSEGLASAIIRLLEHRAFARQIAAAGRAHVERSFSRTQAVAAVRGIYLAHLRHKATARPVVALARP